MSVVLIAPNAFKGALTAREAALAIQKGLSNYKTILFPIADGGDGSLQVLTDMLNAQLIQISVTGPLGHPVRASYGFQEETKTAIIELAEASGIRHLAKAGLNPWKTTTRGTGELIVEAVKRGAREILLTLGGSATVDGGIGILSTLGVRFYKDHREIENPGTADLGDITRYDATQAISLLKNTQITILADVENPMLGPTGAAAVFGPQKGATKTDIPRLERGLENFASVIRQQEGIEVGALKHGGAAGGVAAALHGIVRASLVAGAPAILKLGDFESSLKQADVVITGEGQLDRQTLSGKGPGEVARLAKKAGKKVIGVCGFSELGDQYGYFDRIIEIGDRSMELETNMKRTREKLEGVGEILGI